MLDQRWDGGRSISRETELVASLQREHEGAQLERRLEHVEERRLIHRARDVMHPRELGGVATCAGGEYFAGGVGNRGDFLIAIERRLAELGENPVVVRDVRFGGIEQDAV